MTTILPACDQLKLAKLLELTASGHDGEALNAIRLANALLRRHELTWTDMLTAPVPVTPAWAPASKAPVPSWRESVAACLRVPDDLSEWEWSFLTSLRSRVSISPKQQRCLDGIAARVLRGGRGVNNKEFARAMGPVAREILGEPTEARDRKWRYGTRGSLSVDVGEGTWFDHEAGEGGGVLDFLRLRHGLANGAALDWLRERGHLPAGEAKQPKAGRKIVATYDYIDAAGTLVFQVVRYEPKDFRQRRPDGNGGWLWKMGNVERVIYRLPEVMAAVRAGEAVYIAEGEKAADALASLGVTATCSPGGANKWRKEYSAFLAGADVVILPDNDTPGREHALRVADSLSGVHAQARRVRLLALPGLPEKGDPFNWIAAGGTAAALAALADGVLDFTPKPAAEPRARATSEQAEQPTPTEDDANGAGDAGPTAWRRYLQTDDRGQVIPNLANAAMALRQAPELAGIVAHDEMLRHALVTRSLPGSRMARVIEPRPLADADVAAVQEWLQRHELRRLGKDTVHQAVDLVAREHAFHPVRDYLTALRWDGVTRLDTWLSFYLGAEPEKSDDIEEARNNVLAHRDYTRAIGRMFLIAMVARIMKPGCQADYMLILEGDQGLRKSTVCSILGGPWFSDSLPDVTSGKDVSVHLNGKWLIEVGELAAMSKAEADALKSFITRRVERYRPPYGREEVIAPRQCLFVGTTNQATYLKDETGGRRFWPVKVNAIDLDALEHDRDQLFAEAMAAFRAGEPWWPDGDFERKLIMPRQEARFVVDEWENLLADWLSGDVDAQGRKGPPRATCKVSDAAAMALHLDPGRLGPREQQRITKALKRLGWIPKHDRAGRWWEPAVAPASGQGAVP